MSVSRRTEDVLYGERDFGVGGQLLSPSRSGPTGGFKDVCSYLWEVWVRTGSSETEPVEEILVIVSGRLRYPLVKVKKGVYGMRREETLSETGTREDLTSFRNGFTECLERGGRVSDRRGMEGVDERRGRGRGGNSTHLFSSGLGGKIRKEIAPKVDVLIRASEISQSIER